MGKVFKLNESEFVNIVNRAILEQVSELGMDKKPEGIGPYPAKTTPQFKPESKELATPKVKYGTHESLDRAKTSVKTNLKQALHAMRQLTDMSGVNPEIHGIIPSIEKILTKFEDIYGLPKSELSKEEK